MTGNIRGEKAVLNRPLPPKEFFIKERFVFNYLAHTKNV
jgi:hypothetical protein